MSSVPSLANLRLVCRSLALVGCIVAVAITATPAQSQQSAEATPRQSNPADAAHQTPDELREMFQRKSFSPQNIAGVDSLNYRLLRPRSTDPNEKYALVVFLHGAGERGSDNEAQLKHSVFEFARADRQAEYPTFVIAPQCPKEAKWVEIDWSQPSGTGSFPEQPSPVIAAVMQLVDATLESQPIDPSRVYVTGLSMGGYGTWYAAARWPERVAAAIPVCGGGDPQWAERYDGVPLWALHGQADEAVPIRRSREMIAAIARAGHAPELRYTEYPGVGHDSWTQTYTRDDVFAWLFSQRKP